MAGPRHRLTSRTRACPSAASSSTSTARKAGRTRGSMSPPHNALYPRPSWKALGHGSGGDFLDLVRLTTRAEGRMGAWGCDALDVRRAPKSRWPPLMCYWAPLSQVRRPAPGDVRYKQGAVMQQLAMGNLLDYVVLIACKGR